MKVVDINSDMGEVSSEEGIQRDYSILQYVSSANIACGFHAGDPYTMWRIAKRCNQLRVNVGAHPSFQDRENFGRVRIDIPKEVLIPAILYQVGALQAICESLGFNIFHIKPHGALYNLAADDENFAIAVLQAAKTLGKSLLTLPDSKLFEMAKSEKVRVFAEGFADRQYNDKGRLVPRNLRDSLITDPAIAAERALRLVDGSGIISVEGKVIYMQVQSICIHSDTPNAFEIAKAVRSRLEEAGIKVMRLSEI